MNTLLIAPAFEEFLARGALLGHLQKWLSFSMVNTIFSLMFVGMHIPGWYFMGTLAQTMTRPIGGAFFIFCWALRSATRLAKAAL